MSWNEDAYVLTPAGALGGKTAVFESKKHLGTFVTTDEALAFVKARMEAEQWWPDVVWQSDHGNWWLIDLDGNEVTQPTEEEDECLAT